MGSLMCIYAHDGYLLAVNFTHGLEIIDSNPSNEYHNTQLICQLKCIN